jgi:hypothetical protein
MAGVLDFANYIGGADQIEIIQSFPSSSKVLTYNFGQDITGWTFYMETQTIVVNSVGFDRTSGQPNFAASTVIGNFPVVAFTGDNVSTVIRVDNTASGIVSVTHPAGLYQGPILPDARAKVPMTVVSLTWTDAIGQANSHRYCYVQCWEPGVVSGDPTLDANYSTIIVA